MSASQIQQNLIPNNDISLQAALNLERKRTKLELNCHAVATVQSFDATDQTAMVSIAYQKTYFVYNPITQSYDPKLVPYAVIGAAPVHVNGGGGCSLTFPITKGDECLLAFNDRDIDNWFSGTPGGAVATPRLHSFADAMAFIGFRSKANTVKNYDTTNVQLQCKELTATYRIAGGARFENSIGFWDFNDNADITWDTGTVQGLIGHGGHFKVKQTIGGNYELVDTLISLMTTIQRAQCASPGSPLVMPTFTAFLAQLQSFKEP